MSQADPNEDFLRWSLQQIGLLDLQAFEAPGTAPADSSCSITLWYCAHESQRRQIIINQGKDDSTQAAWSAGLEAGMVFFHLFVDAEHSVTLTLPHSTHPGWHFLAAVMDREQGTLRLHTLDSMTSAPLPDLAFTFESTIRIGGYTDPAGGHYNYTFGRGASGLVDDCRIYQRALSPQAIKALQSPAQAASPVEMSIEAPSETPATRTFRALSENPDATRAHVWDFGDGQRALGAQVTHTYDYAGDYEIRLTVIHAGYAQTVISQTLHLDGAANPLSIVPIFSNGDAGCACFRIPSIVRTGRGTLLAFAEGRVESCSDSTRTVLGAMVRSSDNGQTWEKPRIVFRNIWQGETYAVQNISPVVDTVHNTGRIIVVYNALEHSEWDLARGVGISRACCVISHDEGQTWGEPVDITPSVHRPYNPTYASSYPAASQPANQAHDWRIQRPTLGHAIQLQHGPWRGRIVHAGVFSAGERSVFQSQNYIFCSDDLGQSWHIAGILPQPGLNEATLAELEDGAILVNSRAYGPDDRSTGRRAITRIHFDDAGKLHTGATQYDEALIDPAVQASMLSCMYEERRLLLFANPAHPSARVNMTLRATIDNGQTWPIQRRIDAGPSAYSDMACDDAGKLTLIYERGNEGGIASVTFSLQWLFEN